MAEQTRFGAILKRYRRAAGLSQEALAARAGLSARAISDLERGLHQTPHPSTVDLIATALALSPNQRAVLLAEGHPVPGAPSYLTEMPVRRPPTPPTALIGRDVELQHALALLREPQCRLLTLVGPGGAGKTRLALEIAQAFAADVADEVIFVDLAPLHDETLLHTVLAQAVGLRERTDLAPSDALYSYLAEKRALLLIDSFEHLLAVAPMFADLLARCPNIMLLVTSRAPLQVRGEHILRVAPLALDSAVALFRERALAIRPDRDYPDDLVAAICKRVDCLPLAIELAAVQTRLLPPAQVLEHLMHRLVLLRGGARDLPTRQQTMEDAIAWSYELLGSVQQRCFRALSVFVGGWTLDAARAVCWEANASDTPDALLVLAALVDASLIQADESPDGTVRFRMLDLIHDFALDRLEESREAHECHLRHAQYFAQMADAITHVGPGRLPDGRDPAPEIANSYAALEWADQAGEAALGMRLAGFGRLLHVHGQIREGLAWQERTLALDARTPMPKGDVERGVLRAERLVALGRMLWGLGEYDRAEARAVESLELALRIGDPDVTSNAYMTLGMIAHARGEYDRALSALSAAYEHTSAADQTGQRHRVESLLADTKRHLGHLSEAVTLLERALADAEARGNSWDTARLTTMRGLVAIQQDQFDEATRCFVKALTLFRPFGSPGFTAWCLEGFAAVLSFQGAPVEVARLCAAASGLRMRAQAPAPAAEQESLAAIIAAARASLGEPAFTEVWQAGLTFSTDDAIAAALMAAHTPHSPHSPHSPEETL